MRGKWGIKGDSKVCSLVTRYIPVSTAAHVTKTQFQLSSLTKKKLYTDDTSINILVHLQKQNYFSLVIRTQSPNFHVSPTQSMSSVPLWVQTQALPLARSTGCWQSCPHFSSLATRPLAVWTPASLVFCQVFKIALLISTVVLFRLNSMGGGLCLFSSLIYPPAYNIVGAQ